MRHQCREEICIAECCAGFDPYKLVQFLDLGNVMADCILAVAKAQGEYHFALGVDLVVWIHTCCDALTQPCQVFIDGHAVEYTYKSNNQIEPAINLQSLWRDGWFS